MRAKWHRTNTHKFVGSHLGNTSHIGTNTPKFVPPRWGRPPFDPTQTGLCKFGWVWSSLKDLRNSHSLLEVWKFWIRQKSTRTCHFGTDACTTPVCYTLASAHPVLPYVRLTCRVLESRAMFTTHWYSLHVRSITTWSQILSFSFEKVFLDQHAALQMLSHVDSSRLNLGNGVLGYVPRHWKSLHYSNLFCLELLSALHHILFTTNIFRLKLFSFPLTLS